MYEFLLKELRHMTVGNGHEVTERKIGSSRNESFKTLRYLIPGDKTRKKIFGIKIIGIKTYKSDSSRSIKPNASGISSLGAIFRRIVTHMSTSLLTSNETGRGEIHYDKK